MGTARQLLGIVMQCSALQLAHALVGALLWLDRLSTLCITTDNHWVLTRFSHAAGQLMRCAKEILNHIVTYWELN